MRRLIRFVSPVFYCLIIFQISAFAQNAWQAGVFYAVDSVVTYQTTSYKCLQQHTSQVGWEPPNAPSLWQAQGSNGDSQNVVFSDDFETDKGWTMNADSLDTAKVGMWERGMPQATNWMGAKQLAAHGGNSSLVTGLAGGRANDNDVDGGATTARSPLINLPASGNISLSFWYYFAHNQRSSAADYFRVSIIGSNGRQVVFQKVGRYLNDNAVWQPATVDLNGFAGQTVRVQLEAADFGNDSLVEAGVDDLEIKGVAGGTTAGGVSRSGFSRHTLIRCCIRRFR